MSVHQLLYELDALELHQLRVLVLSAVERHLNLPGACEHLRILDRHLVVQDVRALACESLDHVEGFAVEVAGSVEPGLIVETNGVHDQRICGPRRPYLPPEDGIPSIPSRTFPIC